jgi:hypothetical protein
LNDGSADNLRPMTTQFDQLLPTLTFRLTRDDWAAFERLPAELRGWELLYVYGPLVACGMAMGWFDDEIRAMVPFDTGGLGGKLVLGLTALAVSYLCFAVLMNLRIRRRITRRPLQATDTTVDGDLHGATVTEGGSTRKLSWADLTVIETAAHVFLGPSPREAIILPLRAFDSPEAMHLYAHTARELGNQAVDLP